MCLVYVARSAALGKWASDVGLGKHVYKIGCAPDPDALKSVVAAGWAGEADWSIVKTREIEIGDLTEDAIIDRLAAKEKIVDPFYYPRLKGARGVFRVAIANVERSILVRRTMAGEDVSAAIKPKPADVADYLIRNAVE